MLTRTQRHVARAIKNGARIQICSTAEEPMDDPKAFPVLVHTCPADVDPDGFLYVERVQYRTLFALHLAGKLGADNEIAIGFGGD